MLFVLGVLWRSSASPAHDGNQTGLGVALALAALWLTGALDWVVGAVQAGQRAAQERLAGAIRALRAGQPGALLAFWGLCLTYGVLHASGPNLGFCRTYRHARKA